MSDDVLSVVPADPRWQPDEEAAERTTALVGALVEDPDRGDAAEIDVTWHDAIAVVDCGENLERIGCPRCGAAIDRAWWAEFVAARADDGLADLAVRAPCCGADTSLDALDFHWPCAFARFEIAVWNPGRDRFTAEELTALGDALGQPVRQVLAHF
ncbi:hypothetical protein [Streptomyces sp. NPDC059063]|uniref:hypothetical protein n=1 Tax=unclassified Streptomyces TaxID=2593676 RepID=UPI00367BA755